MLWFTWLSQASVFKIPWLFPDFSLIKVKFPWPNKCKISDMVAASNLRLQQSFAPIWPEMFLPTFDGIKLGLQFQFSLTFLENANFPWPRIKFPDISLTSKNFFFPDHFLNCGNHVWTRYDVEKNSQISGTTGADQILCLLSIIRSSRRKRRALIGSFSENCVAGCDELVTCSNLSPNVSWG